MHKTRSALILIAAAALLFAGSSLAFAQSQHTWVSGTGSDANTCVRSAPCATFAGALTNTAAGGSIGALDSGNFGAVTINKAVTIDGGGNMAVTSGIVVSAGASDSVVLRGLRIDGAGSGANGVDFQSGGSLSVEKCAISDVTTYGIFFESSVASDLLIVDTVIENNTNAVPSPTPAGIILAPSGTGKCFATINRTSVQGYGVGLIARSLVTALVTDSTFTANTKYGINAQASGALVTTERCGLTNNTTAGIAVNASGSTVTISNDIITGNGQGLSIGSSGGAIVSTGNNTVAQNSGKNGAPSSTVAQK